MSQMKVCPRCGATAPAGAPVCLRAGCGQQFPRTRGPQLGWLLLIPLCLGCLVVPLALIGKGSGGGIHASDLIRHADKTDGAAYWTTCDECHGGGRIPTESGWRTCDRCGGAGRRVLAHMAEPTIIPDSEQTASEADAAAARQIRGW